MGYTLQNILKFCLPFAFQSRRVVMIIIFHFNFLLNLIFERKKVADKTTTDLKGQKIRTNQNTPKSDSTPHGFNIRIWSCKSVVPKNLYHKIDLSPNHVFERWRAYLKRWSIISSLPLSKSERTAYCRKYLHDNKTLKKPFCFPLHKTTSGKHKKLSYKRTKTYTYKACLCLQD